MQLEN